MARSMLDGQARLPPGGSYWPRPARAHGRPASRCANAYVTPRHAQPAIPPDPALPTQQPGRWRCWARRRSSNSADLGHASDFLLAGAGRRRRTGRTMLETLPPFGRQPQPSWREPRTPARPAGASHALDASSADRILIRRGPVPIRIPPVSPVPAC